MIDNKYFNIEHEYVVEATFDIDKEKVYIQHDGGSYEMKLELFKKQYKLLSEVNND
jgi:hypothetical protein